MLLLAEEVNARLDAEIVRQPLGGGAVGAVADQDELRGALPRRQAQKSSPHPLRASPAEVRKMHQHGFVRRGEPCARTPRPLASSLIGV